MWARRGRGDWDHQHGGDRGHEQGPGGGQGQGDPAAVLGIVMIILIDCIPYSRCPWKCMFENNILYYTLLVDMFGQYTNYIRILLLPIVTSFDHRNSLDHGNSFGDGNNAWFILLLLMQCCWMVVNVDVKIKVGNQDFSPSKYKRKNDDDTVDGKQRL